MNMQEHVIPGQSFTTDQHTQALTYKHNWYRFSDQANLFASLRPSGFAYWEILGI